VYNIRNPKRNSWKDRLYKL